MFFQFGQFEEQDFPEYQNRFITMWLYVVAYRNQSTIQAFLVVKSK